MATTFSWRVQESSVQFIEPVQTASPSRTAYLWCIRSRQPGIGLTGTPSVSSTCGSVRGGAGKNGAVAGVRRRLVLVEGDPHLARRGAAAAQIASADGVADRPGRRTS